LFLIVLTGHVIVHRQCGFLGKDKLMGFIVAAFFHAQQPPVKGGKSWHIICQ
jgi:hypothetical protein